jgi:hypothetical protein
MEGLSIGVAVVFFGITLWMRRSNAQLREELKQAQLDLAKLKIHTLATAAKAFFSKHGKYPAKLADLVEPLDGSQPFIDTGWQALLDPWGQEHQYRTNEEKGAIFIWTVAPDGTRIDNAPG